MGETVANQLQLDFGSQTSCSSDDENSTFEYQRRRYQCGDFCSFNILRIPGLLLRNLILPKEMWDEFPNGFERIADKFVFQPQTGRSKVPSPRQFGMCYQNVTILTKDKVKLHAYLIVPTTEKLFTGKYDKNRNRIERSPVRPSPTAPTVIYFHGNAGNIGYCLDVVKTFNINSDLAVCNWLLVEYRGYGKSEGTQTEKGLYTDAKAAFDYVESRPDLNSKMIVLYGHSIGGAVAIHLASHRRYRKKLAGLMLENTFTSIPKLAKTLLGLPIINFLPTCCYSSKFESIRKINKVVCPTLFLCGLDDDIVPNSMTQSLYDKCGATIKHLEKFEEADHNNTYRATGFLLKVADFMKDNVITPTSSVSPDVDADANVPAKESSDAP